MAATITGLAGYFKESYGEVEKTIPQFAKVQQKIPFKSAEKVGDSYHFPVFLRQSHGISFAGTSALVGTAFTLASPVSLVSVDANVSGTEAILQEDIAYGVLSRAQSRGPQAFGDAMDEVLLTMKESLDFYKEMNLLYGQTNIGIINSRTDDSGTTQTFDLTAASWASGLWANMENAYVEVFSSDGVTNRTTSDCQVTAIDLAEGTRTITLTGTEAQMDNIVATDIIAPRGAMDATPTYEWFAGIDRICTNTGSLFGISATTYSLWKATTHSAGSAKLTMAKIHAAVNKAVVRGCMEDVCVFVSTYSWVDMANDLSALRRYAQDTRSEMQLGTNELVFHGVNGAKMEIIPHPMIKAGEAFVLPISRWKRIGSSDTTFRLPGVEGQQENFYQELESSAGIRLRGYWDQAIICTHPARCCKITNIVNESLT